MLYHRALFASLLMLAACSSTNSSGTGTGTDSGTTPTNNGPKRTTVTCDDVATAEAQNGTYAKGNWGDIPASLQALPSGATFCGTTSTVLGGDTVKVTHIVSTVWDQEIFDFYNPSVTKLGCTLQAMSTSSSSSVVYSRTSFTCTSGALGTIAATQDTEYQLTYSPPAK